ncbi:hypothetical protein ACFCXR_21140 [Streptomyces noursei]|uniref:hypothetical protein n=1 Tax=Streptomyces TaxID=1883 RepID=UPI0035D9DF7F
MRRHRSRCRTPPGHRRPSPPEPEFESIDVDQKLVLEDLAREQVLVWPNCAAADHRPAGLPSTGTQPLPALGIVDSAPRAY